MGSVQVAEARLSSSRGPVVTYTIHKAGLVGDWLQKAGPVCALLGFRGGFLTPPASLGVQVRGMKGMEMNLKKALTMMAVGMSIVDARAEGVKNFSGSATITSMTNLQEQDAYAKSWENVYGLALKQKLGSSLTLSLSSELSQDMRREGETAISNSKLKLSRKSIEGAGLNITPAAIGILPTEKESRENKSFRGGLGAEVNLAKTLGIGSLSYLLAATKNIHEFERDHNGKANTEFLGVNALSGGLELGAGFSLGATGALLTATTYQGTTKSKFEISEKLGFQATEKLALAIGHTNGGDTLRSNRTDSNIEVFNENTSSVYGTLQMSF